MVDEEPKGGLHVRSDIAYHKNVNEMKLPVDGERNVLVTSATSYVNNIPHLGNIIGSLLSADVFARYCRLRGYNTLFVSGADEYGTATEIKALEEKTSCYEVCTKYYHVHRKIYDWFRISTDYFGRTTSEEHSRITQYIFGKLYKKGLFEERKMTQFYCSSCSRFLADRLVVGTCPSCGADDCLGDQCDACGKLIGDPQMLIDPKCKYDNQKPCLKDTLHLFLNLPGLKDDIKRCVSESQAKSKWSTNAMDITRSWLNNDLEWRCMTRDLKWGAPLPDYVPESLRGKVFYVWFDAPIGYMSMTSSYLKQFAEEQIDLWKKWWMNPSGVQYYQFMGKDNVAFHSVIFVGMLLGTGEDFTIVRHLNATEYLNFEGGKFSKSRGIGVFGEDAIDSGIPSDVWRFYLLTNRPETSDFSFSFDDFQTKTNSELVNNIGNFVNRVFKFTAKYFDSVVPSLKTDGDFDEKRYPVGFVDDSRLFPQDMEYIGKINKKLTEYIQDFESVKIKSALRRLLDLSDISNTYLTSGNLSEKTMRSDREKICNMVNLTVNFIYMFATLMHPFLPTTSDTICAMLGLEMKSLSGGNKESGDVHFSYNDIIGGHSLKDVAVLFNRIDKDMLSDLKKRFGGRMASGK